MSRDGQDRIERDALGEVRVPVDAYYGSQTVRAMENFPVSGIRLPRAFIAATATIKRAAAEVNAALGLLDPKIAQAAISAARSGSRPETENLVGTTARTGPPNRR